MEVVEVLIVVSVTIGGFDVVVVLGPITTRRCDQR